MGGAEALTSADFKRRRVCNQGATLGGLSLKRAVYPKKCTEQLIQPA